MKNNNNTLLTISQFPQWMQESELYKSFSTKDTKFTKDTKHDKNKDCPVGKELMIEPVFTGLRDILKMIDTCAYIGLEKMPRETYEYAILNNDKLVIEMEEFESDEGQSVAYSAFINTAEYDAIYKCVMYAGSIMADSYDKMNLENLGYLLIESIKSDNMPIVRWIVEDLGFCKQAHLEMAVTYKHSHIVEYILAKKPELFVEFY